MSQQNGTQPSGRIVSIDALRGFDMFWIMSGGSLFERLFWSGTGRL